MELNKYERLVETFRDWDSQEQRYGFELTFEPYKSGHKKIATVQKIAGADVFSDKMQRLFENTEVAVVEINIYSGTSSRAKLLNTETIRVRQNSNAPIVTYSPPQPKERKVTERAEPQQTQQQAPPQNSGLNGFDVLMGVLGIEVSQDGLGSVNAGETLKSMLNFRDGILTQRLSIAEKDKEIADLKLKIEEILKQNKLLTSENEKLFKNYEKLEGEIQVLEDENIDLQKYKPENSLLGISLTQLGSAILEKTAINMVKNRPNFVSGLFGIDSATLLGLLSDEEQPAPSAQTVETPDVEISGINDNLTSERKQELAVIEQITKWLKQLSRRNLAYIEALTAMYMQDNELIEMHYNWANGANNKSVGKLEETEEVQEETQKYETV